MENRDKLHNASIKVVIPAKEKEVYKPIQLDEFDYKYRDVTVEKLGGKKLAMMSSKNMCFTEVSKGWVVMTDKINNVATEQIIENGKQSIKHYVIN